MPIHLDCPNGHPLRLKDKMAGKRGVCPKCGVEFAVPGEAPPPLPASVSASAGADPQAVEWLAALPTGDRLGPTVPTLFARWLAEGRIPQDALVWRTGWPEWRSVNDAAADLPAAPPSLPAEPKAAVNPEPSGEIPKIAAPSKARPGSVSYSLQKQREARRRRNFTLGLLVACLLLATMLLWMIVG